MKYPDSVITKNRKGREEVRLLVDKGSYVRYQYMDPKTGSVTEKGKISIILKSNKAEEHLYIIPLKGNRSLLIRPKPEKKKRKLWDKEKKKEVDLF